MLNPIAIDSTAIVNGRYDVRAFAPARWEIPTDFTQPGNPWAVAASNLMWLGSGAVLRAEPKAGIDTTQALLHVGAVLHAVGLPVDHRESAAAFLLSEWFHRLDLADGTRVGRGVQALADADDPGMDLYG